MRRWGSCCVVLLSWTGVACAPALAGQFDYGAGIALEHESNITRTTDPRAEWTQSLFGGIAYAERTVDLTARLFARVERRNFVRNTYQDDTRYFVNGVAVWAIVPQRLSWTAENVATEAPLTLSAPGTPADRVKTNSLSTGPEFTFRVNPTNMPAIGARYGRYDIEGSGDNQRYTGYARWLYRFSELVKLSLNYAATRVDFTLPTPYRNLLRQDQFLRYERLSGLSSLILEGGTTHIRQYGGETTDGRIARVEALHTLNSDSAVRLSLSDQISDSATDLLRGVGSVAGTPATPMETAAAAPLAGSIVGSGDVYHSQRGELTYVKRGGGSIESSLQGHTRRVDYVTTNDQDYREAGGTLTLTWILSRTAHVYARTDYLKRTFQSLDERDTDRTSTLGVTYRLTPSLSVSAEGGRIERESNIPKQGFLDRRVMVFLGYSSGGPLFSPSRW